MTGLTAVETELTIIMGSPGVALLGLDVALKVYAGLDDGCLALLVRLEEGFARVVGAEDCALQRRNSLLVLHFQSSLAGS